MRFLGQDLRLALRGLRRSPGFTAVVLITLALGIGASSAIFSVVNAVLLRPLPYHEPERILTLLHNNRFPVAPANFLDLQTQNRSFERLAAAQAWKATLTGSGVPEGLKTMHVTPDMWPLLGIPPMLGRTFGPEDARPGAARSVVLSHRLWQRRFGGDVHVVGRPITLNGEVATVVGVMPPGFEFAPFWWTGAELWAPLDLTARRQDRDGQSLRVFGRLGSGVSQTQAQGEMNALWQRLAREYPGSNRGIDLRVDSLHEQAVGKVRRALLVLLAGVGLVLLIACANVANLVLARSASRRKELAIRASLGASPGRIFRQLLTESVVLAALGGGLGLLVAQLGIDLLVALAPSNLPRLETIALDGRVFGVNLLVSVATGLIFGLLPAWQLSRTDLKTGLRDGGRSVTEGARRIRTRSLLVVSEVALALMLLIGAGLLFRSFERLRAVDAGFDPNHALSLVVSLEGPRHADGARRAETFRALIDRVRALPGVKTAGAINHLPINGDLWSREFSVPGAPPERRSAVYRIITPGYLEALGLSLTRGRDFNESDGAGAAGVAIINESFARGVWPGQDPLGKYISVLDGGPDPRQIVGVVKDAKQRDWTGQPAPEMYLAYLQNPAPRELALVVRAQGDTGSLTSSLERAVGAIDGTLPVPRVIAMNVVVARAIGQPRFNLFLLHAFALVALLLAAVGIYGVMAHSVSSRTHEIGIRLALGAHASQVRMTVLLRGLRLAGLGVALGLLGALATTHLLSALLFEVSATDLPTFAALPVALILVAILASYLPARRATLVDPMIALRAE